MYFLGVDGGGTRTTIGLADEAGGELARRTGPPGIVDPRWPLAAVESVVRLAREALEAAGVAPPVEALCAGLAGTGDPAGREVVQRALGHAGVAKRVVVCSDGEIALEGSLAGQPGVLLVAGTGSIAWGRAEDGRVERCGGWGRIAGDEGSAFWLGCQALRAALRACDARGEDTVLLPALIERLATAGPDGLPAWAGRAEKAEIAALAQLVVHAAEAGDAVSRRLVHDAAAGLVEHAVALADRLGPWSGKVRVVLHGGLGEQALFAKAVKRRLEHAGVAAEIAAPVADAVTGALNVARRLGAADEEA